MTDDALRGTRSVQVAAQAKVNLRLRILARETSGYHQLETLFLRLTLADTVRVRRTDKGHSLDVSGVDSLVPMERNIAWRAALAYMQASGWTDGFAIELEKRIPVGGGLGGGSADAGAVLRALDAIATRPLGKLALLQLAAALGADVPFLTTEHPYALAWGRGERMLALEPPPSRGIVLVVPPFAVNTAEAYGWIAALPNRALAPAAALLDPAALRRWEHLAALAVNDFEVPVAARHPAIDALVAALAASGCAPAMLSGSGSTVFGVLPEGAAAPELDCAVDAEVRRILTQSAVRVEPVVPVD